MSIEHKITLIGIILFFVVYINLIRIIIKKDVKTIIPTITFLVIIGTICSFIYPSIEIYKISILSGALMTVLMLGMALYTIKTGKLTRLGIILKVVKKAFFLLINIEKTLKFTGYEAE